MKTDLTTSILTAIAGVVIAFLVMQLFLPTIEDVTIKVLSSSPSTSLANPDPEIFNYRAINPTVEVYVGQCTEYNEKGECINVVTDINNPGADEDDQEDDDTDNTNGTNDTNNTNNTDNTSDTDDDFDLLDNTDNSNASGRTRDNSNGGSN